MRPLLSGVVAVVFLSACGPGGMTGGTGGSGGTGGTGGSPPTGPAPRIPAATEACPTLATGTATFLGQSVQLWVGQRQTNQKGPVLFYWHGTGSVPGEASAFMGPQINEIVAQGGIVASFASSTNTGDYTGPFVWHSDDFAIADQILACAVQQLNIDTRRIYSAGCSAGGLQTSAMVYRRSSYLAAAMPNSGGIATPGPFEDPSHIPAVITTHGALDQDVVVLQFARTSDNLDKDVVAHGGFAVDCDHGGGHCGAPPEVIAAQWQFLKDHPFGYQIEPYASGLPASFPSYCQVTEATP